MLTNRIITLRAIESDKLVKEEDAANAAANAITSDIVPG
jgi:hypothetical protein